MKNLIITFLFSFLFVTDIYPQSLKVSSFNIRYDNPGDGVHQWENRKESVVSFIKIEKIDVLGMQEVLHSQIDYLDKMLPEYIREGVGRDDGDTEGEYAPIYFNSNRFEKIEGGTFWLSPDTDKPNVGWDAALPRICTYLKLLEKDRDKPIYVFNTHYDHVGNIARMESTRLILQKIEEIAQGEASILLGDLNLEPDSQAVQDIISNGFTDSFTADLKLGPVGTFNDFKIAKRYDKRIDYVFLKGFLPISYKVNSMLIQDTFLSDHFPVIVEINEK